MIDYWMVDANVAEKLHARAVGYSHPAVEIMKSGGRPPAVAYTRHYPPDTRACRAKAVRVRP